MGTRKGVLGNIFKRLDVDLKNQADCRCSWISFFDQPRNWMKWRCAAAVLRDVLRGGEEDPFIACHKISSKSLSFMDTLDTYNFPKVQKIFSSMASIESACILKGTLPVATPLRLHKHWWHYCNLSQPQVHLPEELVNCMKSNLKVETSLWASRKFGKNLLKYHKIYWNAETESLPPRNWYHWATPLPPPQIQWRLIRLSFGLKTQHFI